MRIVSTRCRFAYVALANVVMNRFRRPLLRWTKTAAGTGSQFEHRACLHAQPSHLAVFLSLAIRPSDNKSAWSTATPTLQTPRLCLGPLESRRDVALRKCTVVNRRTKPTPEPARPAGVLGVLELLGEERPP